MWLNQWSHTLRWRLIWPSIALNLVAVVATIWVADYALRETLLQHAIGRARIISHAVNYAAESTSHLADLQRFVYSLGAEDDINLIIVVSSRPARVLACTRHEWNHSNPDALPWPEASQALHGALHHNHATELQLSSTGEFQVTIPILLTNGEQSGLELQHGAVLVRLDQSIDRSELAHAIWMAALWFIFQLLIVNALVLLLIQHRILRPLKLIDTTLKKRREGDSSARAPILAEDEIGGVARAMNAVFDRREELETEATTRAAELTETNRLLRESEERFRIAAESATDVIYDWNIQTGQIAWHRDIGSALGYAPQEFPWTLEAWKNAMHPEDRPRIMEAVEYHIATGQPYDFEYRMIAKDGHVMHWRDRGSTLRDSNDTPRRMIGVMTDVTIERLASQHLLDAKNASEAANRAKDEFLAALSHELRTPLSPVLMLAGEMERSPDIPPDLREGFALIRHNVELEARLIDDLLDLTRITRGKFHLESRPLDIYAILEKAIDTVHTNIEARGLTLQVELVELERLQVVGDPVRLQQVFWNVLKNAAKFTAPGGRILIRSQVFDSRTLRISITDTGIGIASENLERIFDAFEQVQHTGSHRFGGLGLGLAISRRLVEAHGGRIWAESSGQGQGTTFHIELPLSTVSGERISQPEPGTPSAGLPSIPLRILLVEDHDETRAILERLLKRRGHEVAPSADLTTARQLASEHDFDLVISDIGLPDGTGYDLMSELRKAHPTLLGIALSGFGMEQDIQKSRNAGFFAHLTKPVDMSTLDRAINEVQHQDARNGERAVS